MTQKQHKCTFFNILTVVALVLSIANLFLLFNINKSLNHFQSLETKVKATNTENFINIEKRLSCLENKTNCQS